MQGKHQHREATGIVKNICNKTAQYEKGEQLYWGVELEVYKPGDIKEDIYKVLFKLTFW